MKGYMPQNMQSWMSSQWDCTRFSYTYVYMHVLKNKWKLTRFGKKKKCWSIGFKNQIIYCKETGKQVKNAAMLRLCGVRIKNTLLTTSGWQKIPYNAMIWWVKRILALSGNTTSSWSYDCEICAKHKSWVEYFKSLRHKVSVE